MADFDSAAAQQRMAPVPRGWQKRVAPPKRAAVMILIFQADDEGLRTVLTLRSAGLRGHSGQISFPGGRQEPQDTSLEMTAVRETCEEIGVCGAAVNILGQLPGFYIPASHYDVAPIVASHRGSPSFALNPVEVAAVFSVALDDLLQPRFKREEQRVIRGYDVRVPYYDVDGRKVWGATAMMLSELEGRLRQVVPRESMLVLDKT